MKPSIPDYLAQPFREALRHYPELEHTKIRLKILPGPVRSTMSARPSLPSLLVPDGRRTFLILISPLVWLGGHHVPISRLPGEVLVGWFGHELGHIMDYRGRSGLELIWFGLRYVLSPSFLRAAEFRADYIAVHHGLEEAILRTKRFILEEADIPWAYKRRILRYYSSPEEIEALVAQLAEET